MANDLNNLIKKRSNPFGDGKFSSITDIQKEIEREENHKVMVRVMLEGLKERYEVLKRLKKIYC